MPVTIPRSVRSALGDEATDDFARWFEEALGERAVQRDEYREVLSRLDGVELRLGRLESDVHDLHRGMNELRREMNECFDRMNERFDRMHEQMRVTMRWTVGTIALVGVIVTVLLAIAEFSV